MSFSSSPYYNGRVYAFTVFLLLTIALTFLIIGASLHNLYSFDAASVADDVESSYNVTVSGSAHLGAFYSCIDFDGATTDRQFTWAIHDCIPLPTDCRAHFTVYTSFGEVDVDEQLQGFTCSQYNAFRAFLVIGIILLGTGLVLAALSLLVPACQQSRGCMWGAVGLVGGAVVAVAISYGLVADHMKELEDDLVKFHTGPAFALCVTAWCLMVVAVPVFVVVKRAEKEEEFFGKHVDEGADKTVVSDTA